MDVLPIIFICGAFLAVMSQESGENSTDVDIEFTTRRPTVTTPFPLNCTTAHAVEGVCTARTSCDYGTPAIDRTLYKPSWYKSLCATEEVCCPFVSLLTQPSQTAGETAESGGIGQDDDESF